MNRIPNLDDSDWKILLISSDVSETVSKHTIGIAGTLYSVQGAVYSESIFLNNYTKC